jgi:hypothetical protein
MYHPSLKNEIASCTTMEDFQALDTKQALRIRPHNTTGRVCIHREVIGEDGSYTKDERVCRKNGSFRGHTEFELSGLDIHFRCTSYTQPNVQFNGSCKFDGSCYHIIGNLGKGNQLMANISQHCLNVWDINDRRLWVKCSVSL